MRRPRWRTPPATVTVNPNETATMPNNSCTSASCQPRSVVTRRISTHQNTKNVKLLSAMNTTCSTNAPRSASVAFRLVATRARAKARLFEPVTCHPPLMVTSVAARRNVQPRPTAVTPPQIARSRASVAGVAPPLASMNDAGPARSAGNGVNAAIRWMTSG